VHKCAPWLLQFLTFFFFSIAFPQISDFSWKMKGSAFSSFPCAFWRFHLKSGKHPSEVSTQYDQYCEWVSLFLYLCHRSCHSWLILLSPLFTMLVPHRILSFSTVNNASPIDHWVLYTPNNHWEAENAPKEQKIPTLVVCTFIAWLRLLLCWSAESMDSTSLLKPTNLLNVVGGKTSQLGSRFFR
jgi:hypothetical protein